MKQRLAAVIAAAVPLGLATGAPGEAAVLRADKQCYQEREPVRFAGGPFTPNGVVGVTLDGAVRGTLQAQRQGVIAGELGAPTADPKKERRFALMTTDFANPALTFTLTPLVTELSVAVRPTGGGPATRRRIAARGFTGGGILYAHVVRGRARRTVRIGNLRGACGTLRARKRIFRRGTRNGVYRVQFDATRRYRRTTRPRVTFPSVRIFTVFRPRASTASAASLGEGRARTD